MKTSLNRREFLKLGSLLPAHMLYSRLTHTPLAHLTAASESNVLIIVFDTWSAKHLSLYGYRRKTTPHLERIADRAIVYHNHYAAAPWTVPGTASLLSGLLPWTHRVFDQLEHVKVSPNLFPLFADNNYFLRSYTHNPLANLLIEAYAAPDQERLPPESLFLAQDPYYHKWLNNDKNAYYLARNQVYLDEDEVTNSLFFSKIVRRYLDRFYQQVLAPYLPKFPNKPPVIAGSNDYFLLEDALDWVMEILPQNPQPYMNYFHFYPPHAPYHPRIEFNELFNDNWKPKKKFFPFPNNESRIKTNIRRAEYDRFVAYVDAEFAQLFEGLQRSGLLDNTWLILTSDHGELFERGIIGHTYITLHEPLIHIPLLIFPPKQTERLDIYDRTSAIDVLPTLLHLTQQPIPPALEGTLLPPFQKNYQGMQRTIFSMNPRHSDENFQLTEGTIAVLKDQYKLSYYFGHEEMQGQPTFFELYDVVNDPEEFNNLYSEQPKIASDLFEIIQTHLNWADSPYPTAP